MATTMLEPDKVDAIAFAAPTDPIMHCWGSATLPQPWSYSISATETTPQKWSLNFPRNFPLGAPPLYLACEYWLLEN